MKKDALRVTTTIPVAPTTLYFAWLDSEQHTAMTGSPAKIEPTVGSKYTARDGYISGKLVTLDLGRRIIMSWRTTDFPRDAHDSRVEVHFEGLGAGTRVLILHTEIPEGQGEKYRTLWNNDYFTPMRTHVSKFLPDPRDPPVRRLPPPPPEDDEEEEEVLPKKGKGKAAVPGKGPSVAKAAPSKPALPTKGAKPAPPPAAKPPPAAPARPAKPAPKPATPAKKPAKPAPKPAKPAPKPAKKPAKPAPKPAKKPAKPAPKKPAKKPAKPAPKKPAKKR